MDTRPQLTNCICCDEPQNYLWQEGTQGLPDINEALNLNDASKVTIEAGYGSVFDSTDFEAVICDNCVTRLVSRNQIKLIKNWLA